MSHVLLTRTCQAAVAPKRALCVFTLSNFASQLNDLHLERRRTLKKSATSAESTLYSTLPT